MENNPDRDWVVIAHLTRARGNKGELSAIALTGHPERYDKLPTVYVLGSPYQVERVWYHKDQPVFKLQGIDTIGDAERLAGQDVCIPASERYPLPEGEYYFADLMGCRVVDAATETVVGTVTGWQELGGPVVLELDDGRVLVPYAKAILQDIDVEARVIRANLPEGLADLNG